MIVIPFVVTNHNKCSCYIPSSASVRDLHIMVIKACKLSLSIARSPIEIVLPGDFVISTLTSPSNTTIGEIEGLRSVANELRTIWGPGFRIPIRVRFIASEEDLAVYASLIRMFGGSKSNIHEFQWYHFASRCVETGSCIVQDICDWFKKFFHCEHGDLVVITLSHQHITGYVDLTATPRTVERLFLERNVIVTDHQRMMTVRSATKCTMHSFYGSRYRH